MTEEYGIRVDVWSHDYTGCFFFIREADAEYPPHKVYSEFVQPAIGSVFNPQKDITQLLLDLLEKSSTEPREAFEELPTERQYSVSCELPYSRGKVNIPVPDGDTETYSFGFDAGWEGLAEELLELGDTIESEVSTDTHS